jgi:hypothetical protein
VRDALDAVARAPAFDVSLREQVLAALRDLLARLLRALGAGGARSPALFWVAAAVAAVAIAWAAARALDRREAARRRARPGGDRAGREDPLRAADRAAAEGRYGEAAHHLYAAAVAALAARGLVRPHPSKTAGDYAREVRRRAAAAAATGPSPAAATGDAAHAAAAYGRFARGFEAVVYGPRPADRAAFDALRAAVAPVVAPAAARAGFDAADARAARPRAAA